jgi:hypothetical protein
MSEINAVSDKRILQSYIFAWSMFIAVVILRVSDCCPGYYLEPTGWTVMLGTVAYGLNMTFNR